MITSTTRTLAPGAFDTREMVIVHRVFRRESRLLAELVEAVEPGDARRAGVLAEHFADYAFGLHTHHHGEDDLLWPPLASRVQLADALVDRMRAQHERVAATLAAAEAGVAAWVRHPGADERDALVAVLVEHRSVLVEHLDQEEREVLPLAAKYLTAVEWARMGEHFVASTPKPKVLMYLGSILEDTTPDERALMLGVLPRPARLVWALVGRRRYARHIARVRRG